MRTIDVFAECPSSRARCIQPQNSQQPEDPEESLHGKDPCLCFPISFTKNVYGYKQFGMSGARTTHGPHPVVHEPLTLASTFQVQRGRVAVLGISVDADLAELVQPPAHPRTSPARRADSRRRRSCGLQVGVHVVQSLLDGVLLPALARQSPGGVMQV